MISKNASYSRLNILYKCKRKIKEIFEHVSQRPKRISFFKPPLKLLRFLSQNQVFWEKIFLNCVFSCVFIIDVLGAPPPPQLDQPDFQLVVNNLAIPLSIPIMLSIYCTAIFYRQYSTLSSKCAKFCNSTLVS